MTAEHRDLSVDLCGVRLQTPVLAASGCFGFGREMAGWVDLAAIGGIVTKSVSLESRRDPADGRDPLGDAQRHRPPEPGRGGVLRR
jgi:hypothetical protein